MFIIGVRELFRESYFKPGFFSLLTNPYHLARKRLYGSIAAHAQEFYGRILDVGCGTKPYERLFTNVSSYIGLDIDQPRNRERAVADYFYDGNMFPFADGSFDGLICNQVLEHVFEPEKFCKELSRVVAPGGKLLITVPFVWDEHEQPWDSQRYTSFGLKELLLRSGFVILRQEKMLIGFSAFVQLAQARLQKGAIGGAQRRFGKFSLIVRLLNFPLNLIGEIMDLFPDANSDFYLDNFVLAEKTSECR